MASATSRPPVPIASMPRVAAGAGMGVRTGKGFPPGAPKWCMCVGWETPLPVKGTDNFFVDHGGRLWATFFRNPNFGYWSHPSRIADAAVPGVVRLEWTGPEGDRLYVQRRKRDGVRG
ncbi:hypothetical protein SANTM175S_06848 [Streptomyces antimycoticus]